MGTILAERITMKEFINFDYYGHRYDEFTKAMSDTLLTGQIHCREQAVDDLKSAPKAFIGILEGQN